MTTERMEEAGVLETDSVLVRTMCEDDLNAIVTIDAAATGRRRPRYFEVMLQRAVTKAGLQISLVAEMDNCVVGFVIGSLYYGEYGVVEPSASIDAITVAPRSRGKYVGKALMRQLRGRLSGLCQPAYMPDIPGGHGKSPLGPSYVERAGVNGRAHWIGRQYSGHPPLRTRGARRRGPPQHRGRRPPPAKRFRVKLSNRTPATRCVPRVTLLTHGSCQTPCADGENPTRLAIDVQHIVTTGSYQNVLDRLHSVT